MGGYGSGRRWGAKDTTEDRWPIDVRKWKRNGSLAPGTRWTHTRTLNGNDVGSICTAVYDDCVKLMYKVRERRSGGEWEPREYFVNLERTRCNYGGTRPWFLCPGRGCGRRVAILYSCGGYFLCRQCHRLAYECQRESDLDRTARRLRKLTSRLCEWATIFDGMPPRPKGMHRRTYDRREREYRWRKRLMNLEAIGRFGPGFRI